MSLHRYVYDAMDGVFEKDPTISMRVQGNKQSMGIEFMDVCSHSKMMITLTSWLRLAITSSDFGERFTITYG